MADDMYNYCAAPVAMYADRLALAIVPFAGIVGQIGNHVIIETRW